MISITFKNVRLIDPLHAVDITTDLVIREGVIQPLGSPFTPHVVEATGLIAAPGFWDTHVHFRDPGNPVAETRKTGAAAAAAAGFTHVVTMPNTSPAGDSVAWLETQRFDATLPVSILPSACITQGRRGETLAELKTLAEHGASCFTDDGSYVATDALMRAAMREAKTLNRTIFDHAVVPTLAKDGVIRDCPAARTLGLPIFPAEAEIEAVRRDIALCRETGCRLVIQHLSTAGAVALIRAAQAEGLPVTAEASPHHLACAAEEIPGDDPDWKMNPPLGTREDIRAIRAAVLDNTLQLFATDHAPHTAESKARGFRHAPFGVIGLETAIGITYKVMVIEENMAVDQWIRRWTLGPAEVLGLPLPSLAAGEIADLVLIDTYTPWTVQSQRFHSLARNTPFEGWTLPARALLTIAQGKLVYNTVS